VGPDYPLAITDLEVGAAGTAEGGNHQCGLELVVAALRADDLDAMALGLIGHGLKIRLARSKSPGG
jgi:hypothetical protein